MFFQEKIILCSKPGDITRFDCNHTIFNIFLKTYFGVAGSTGTLSSPGLI
jgi:hypothetical protein